VADINRIHWPICSGFGGRFTPESLADLHRIMHLQLFLQLAVVYWFLVVSRYGFILDVYQILRRKNKIQVNMNFLKIG